MLTRAILPAPLLLEREEHAHHHPKTDVIVEVVRIVPDAVGTARVPFIVVPRPTAQHPVTIERIPAACRDTAACHCWPVTVRGVLPKITSVRLL
jgi:hypothetical protein